MIRSPEFGAKPQPPDFCNEGPAPCYDTLSPKP